MNHQFYGVLGLSAIVLMTAILFINPWGDHNQKIMDFKSCVVAGNPVMESYPRQCRANGKNFIEEFSDIERNQQTQYFIEKFQERAIELLGAMPIEGFNPELYLQVYRGLEKRDFDNTESIGGTWKFSNNKLIFIRTPEGPITSADSTLTDKGLEKLLDNIAQRLNISETTQNNIDKIIESLE